MGTCQNRGSPKLGGILLACLLFNQKRVPSKSIDLYICRFFFHVSLCNYFLFCCRSCRKRASRRWWWLRQLGVKKGRLTHSKRIKSQTGGAVFLGVPSMSSLSRAVFFGNHLKNPGETDPVFEKRTMVEKNVGWSQKALCG